jgi:large subunit ribosomal protein L10
MSKVIKQMEMDALRSTFDGVRDLVVLSISGLNSIADNSLRATLQKKNIRLRVIKNSLTRRVFGEMGLGIKEDSPFWQGPTTLAWGAGNIAELSRAIDSELKNAKTAAAYKDKVKVKGAVVDGQVIAFELALTMPTLPEALANVISLALAPASRLVSQLQSPGAQVASQIKTLSEKKDEAPTEAAAEAPTATPA